MGAEPAQGAQQEAGCRGLTLVRPGAVSNTLSDIDTVFPDAELIGKLGSGSVVNLPLILGGKVIATMNILHEEGYCTPERVAQIHDVLRLPATAVCAVP